MEPKEPTMKELMKEPLTGYLAVPWIILAVIVLAYLLLPEGNDIVPILMLSLVGYMFWLLFFVITGRNDREK